MPLFFIFVFSIQLIENKITMTVFEPQISSYRTTNCATTTARVVLVCIEAVESNLVKPDTSRTVILPLMASVLLSLSHFLSKSQKQKQTLIFKGCDGLRI